MGVIYLGSSLVPSTQYGIVVETPPVREFAARNVSTVTVPGKNGNIIVDTGSYANVSREYNIAVGAWKGDYYSLVNNIRVWLNNATGSEQYYRLSDSYEPDVYRMARFDEAGTFNNIHNQGGRITVRFNCKPQRFLNSGDTPINIVTSTATSASTTIQNNYLPAKPLIVITGSGDALLTVAGVRVNINGLGSSETIQIDSESMQAFHTSSSGNTTNKNHKIQLLDDSFPILESGSNSISIAAQEGKSFSMTRFRVYPRWWML